MNALQLEKVREVLSLTIPQAAQHIGNTSPQQWAHWESGNAEMPICELTVETIRAIAETYTERLEKLLDDKGAALAEYHFETLADYQKAHPDEDFLEWKISQGIYNFCLFNEPSVLKETG